MQKASSGFFVLLKEIFIGDGHQGKLHNVKSLRMSSEQKINQMIEDIKRCDDSWFLEIGNSLDECAPASIEIPIHEKIK